MAVKSFCLGAHFDLYTVGVDIVSAVVRNEKASFSSHSRVTLKVGIKISCEANIGRQPALYGGQKKGFGRDTGLIFISAVT